jgi:hypothetical protein
MIEFLADQYGVLLRRDAVANGVDDNALARLRRAGHIVRIRQGVYVLADQWRQASDADRHLMLVQGVMALYDDRVAASHVSACLKQGGPSWGLPLARAHITNLFGLGDRRQARVVHHRGQCRVGDVTRLDDHWITAPPRTALDTASILDRDPAVCVLDDFVHRGLATPDDYQRILDQRTDSPDHLDLQTKVDLCDGRSESVGETRSRLLFRDQRLPTPVPQWEIFHPDGRLAGRSDFALPAHELLVEFDGASKYGRLRRPGESIEDVVMREKARENLLRELTGWMMIRLVWADLDDPARTADRIRRCLRQVAA